MSLFSSSAIMREGKFFREREFILFLSVFKSLIIKVFLMPGENLEKRCKKAILKISNTLDDINLK